MALIDDLVGRLQALGFAPGEATNEGVATVVAEPGPTRTAIDARVTGVGDTRYAPLWQASTDYAINAPVLLPAPVSAVGKRTAAGTSRATFDATEQGLWTVAAAASPLPSGGSVGQLLAKTADGAGWTDAAAGGGISQSAADSRYSQSIYLRDFCTSAKTNTENRTSYIAAIAAAAAGSKRLCYDGAFFTYAGETVTDTNADMVHWASSWGTHKICQGTKGYGALTLAGPRSRAENLNVDGLNDAMDFTGVTIGGAQTFRHSAGVRLDPTAHGSTIRNLRAKGFFHASVAASLTAAQVTSGGVLGTRLKDCIIDGVYSDNCWTALQYIAVDGLTVRRLEGTYTDVIGSGGEAHIIYGGGYNLEPSYNVSIFDCDCSGGKQHGTADYAGAYKITNTIGLTIGNLRARDCPGLLSLEKCFDFVIGPGLIGVRDTAVGAAPMVQLADCGRGAVAPIVAKSVAQLTNGAAAARVTRCTNVQIDSLRITVAPATNPGTIYMLVVSGDCSGSRIKTPELISEGAEVQFGMMVDAGTGGTTSNIEIEDPRTVGAIRTAIRLNLKDATVKYRTASLVATFAKIQIDATATPSKVVNLDNPNRIDTHPRALGWHYGEMAGGANGVSVWPSGQGRLYMFGNDWLGNQNGRITVANNARRMFAATFLADVDLSVDVRLSTGVRAGICLRANGDSTYLTVSRAAGAVKIHKIVAGALTELATAAVTVPDGMFANLRAVIIGASIQVLLNGIGVLSYTLTGGDETTFVSAGHGLYGDTAGASAWENVRVLGVA